MRNVEKDTINVVIGKHMAELRTKFNLSQKELCQVIGVNRNTYKDYEIGTRTIPFQVIRDLANFYKVSYNYFFEDMPDLTPKEHVRLLNYSLAVSGDKQKYLTIDVRNPKSIKKHLDNNKTQEEIAKYLGVVKSTYSKYESGKRKLNNDIVKKLADYYDIKVSDIID